MRRRTPGRPAVPPLRRRSGVVAVLPLVLGCSLIAGGVAHGVAGVGASGTDGAPTTAVSATTIPTSNTTVAPAPTDDAGSDADDDGGSSPVETSTVTLTDEDRNRTFTATLRIPVTDDPVPVVVVVHGYAATAADYATLAETLAAAGYAVVSPDFPGSSSAATANPTRDIAAQATDVSYLLGALFAGTTVPELTARLDPARIAVIGHSDGGVTTAGIAFNDAAADPRIGAAVVLSGGAFGFPGAWFSDDTPPALLVVHGTADTVNPFAASISLFDQAVGTRWLVAVEGGDHVGPFTDGAAVADVAVLVATFLDATLGGDAAAASALPAAAAVGDLTLVAAA